MGYRGNVVLFGACGFIGKNLMESLYRYDYSIVAVDKVTKNCGPNLASGITLIEGDVLNFDFVLNILETYNPQGVVHLVGLPHIPTCENNPHESYYANVLSVHNVLEAMRKLSIERIVFTSTGAVYGSPSDRPISENYNTIPQSIYGWHKLQAEMEIKAYATRYHLKGVILRLFNVYGNKPGIGRDVVSIFTWRIMNKMPVVINGPRKFRDFVYVHDVAKAIQKSLEINLDNEYEVINIGTGIKTTLLDLARKIQELVGERTDVITKEDPFDGTGYYADNSKMKKLLGFNPMTLDDGLKKYLKEVVNH